MPLEFEDLSEKVIKAFFEAYNDVGHGFLESVYQNAFQVALTDAGLLIEPETSWELRYRSRVIGSFRLDLLVERTIIVECKACEKLVAAHESQALNYLAATKLPLALLFNFGPRPTFKRLIAQQEKTKSSNRVQSTRIMPYR